MSKNNDEGQNKEKRNQNVNSSGRGNTQHNRGGYNYYGRGRSRGRNAGRANHWYVRPQCQVCWKFRHEAWQCYHRNNQSYGGHVPYSNNTTYDHPRALAPAQAMIATPEILYDPNWYPDSGASSTSPWI